MESSRTGKFLVVELDQSDKSEGKALYRLFYEIHKDEFTNGYVATSPNLPGVIGDRETEELAENDLFDAARLAIETYLQNGMPIPWRAVPEHLQGSYKTAFVEVKESE